MRRSATLLRTVFLAALATVAAGQKGEVPPDDPTAAQIKKAAAEAEAAGEAEREGGDAVATVGGPRNVAMASVQVATQPRRLAPGEVGQLLVIVALNNPAVITADTPVSLEYAAEQDGMRLGTFQVRPAEPGTLPTKFRGSPVYDNTVTLELPLEIDANTAPGYRTVSMTMVSRLTHATTGNDLGEVRVEFGGRVHVGRPLPQPGVVGTAAPAIGVGSDAGDGRSAPPVKPGAANAAAAPPPKTPVRGSGGVRAAAVGIDGVALDLLLPDDAVLAPGASYELTALLRVPDGEELCRDPGLEPRLTVHAGDQVAVTVGGWPARAGRVVEVPVRLEVAADAAHGVREIQARATYRLRTGDGPPADETTLTASAIVAVGAAGLVADPLWFWAIGGAFGLAILAVVVRMARR